MDSCLPTLPGKAQVVKGADFGLDFTVHWKVYIVEGREVMAMEVKQKVSLCPECDACPEVEVLHEGRRPVAVRIGEGGEQITLPIGAWNTLVRYVREGILNTL